jgi:hypothetical protein
MMSGLKRPLFGVTWTDHQVELFEQWKDEALSTPASYFFDEAEVKLAWCTWQVLTVMLAKTSASKADTDDLDCPAPHERPTLIQQQSTALDIVCRTLLGESGFNGTPTLKRRDHLPPDPPPHVLEVIHLVAYWLEQHEDLVKPDQLKRLKEALNIALADRAAYKKARRSRRR